MKTWALMIVLQLSAAGMAQTLDFAFVGASIFAMSSTFADSYTTAWIRPNWLAKPRGQIVPCGIEVGEPWLYGEHPTLARAYGVGLGKMAAAETLAITLKRSRRRHLQRLWALPLLVMGIDSSMGALHNFVRCPEGLGR